MNYRGDANAQTLEIWVRGAIQNIPVKVGLASFSGSWNNHSYGVRGIVSRSDYGSSDIVFTGFAYQYDSNVIMFFTCAVSSDHTISEFKSKSL